jgi:flagellar basal-body rod protein FlgG
MNDAMFIAATGMQTQQTNLDTIANNVVNASTPAFKRSAVSFTDMVTTQPRAAGATGPEGLLGPARVTVFGVGLARVAGEFEAGDLKKTDSPYDIAVRGDGFISVAMADGAKAVTRGGTLKVNADGMLATQAGVALKPGIAIPDNALSLVIRADGRVQVTLPNQAAPHDVGQLELVRFANPDQLNPLGDNLYEVTDASGELMSADGVGTVAQGYLEGSNVKMVDEMVNLMLAQRAYDASVKVIQASDEMLAAANNLRK